MGVRIVHTADVHLGARHADLGERAAAQRERQFAAFRATVDLAIEASADLFLVAGDLFDSNVQPRRSVERVAAELGRLAGRRIRSVLLPGTHDVCDRSSIYRAYDLAELAGVEPGSGLVTVLTPERPEVRFPELETVVFGRLFPTKRAPRSPLAGFSASGAAETWKIGMIHGSLLVPGRTDGDEVVFSAEEVAASGLDYLALGHWHAAQSGTAGSVRYAYAGAPEPVAVDQDRAGKALLVTLSLVDGVRTVEVEERVVGRTRFVRQEVDVATVASQPALVERLAAQADPDVVLDVRLVGVRSDELDVDGDEVVRALAPSFLAVRFRDRTLAPLPPDDEVPGPDTILGALVRDLEARVADAEAAGGSEPARAAEAAELRDALLVARHLLAGSEVTL
ncbi:MAG: DNA repair exonuclease [Chloroflexi bacterium]|nr:DNA repair exonuclease [Chloroflexota bacterium]